MSHFSVLAVGFSSKEELHKTMHQYDEAVRYKPYISKTKTEILELGKTIYSRRCEALSMYNNDPISAKEKYGNFAEDVAANKDNETLLYNQSDPEKFYEMFTKDCILDENGNLLTTYNPNAKYDYYDITTETTIGALKTEQKQHALKVDEKLLSHIWNVIVNKKKAEDNDMPLLMYLPDRNTMLKLYGSMKNYIKSMKQSFAPTYCVVTPSGWYEPGAVDMLGFTSADPKTEKEFRETFFSKFIMPYPSETKVYILDCHT